MSGLTEHKGHLPFTDICTTPRRTAKMKEQGTHYISETDTDLYQSFGFGGFREDALKAQGFPSCWFASQTFLSDSAPCPLNRGKKKSMTKFVQPLFCGVCKSLLRAFLFPFFKCCSEKQYGLVVVNRKKTPYYLCCQRTSFGLQILIHLRYKASDFEFLRTVTFYYCF